MPVRQAGGKGQGFVCEQGTRRTLTLYTIVCGLSPCPFASSCSHSVRMQFMHRVSEAEHGSTRIHGVEVMWGAYRSAALGVVLDHTALTHIIARRYAGKRVVHRLRSQIRPNRGAGWIQTAHLRRLRNAVDKHTPGHQLHSVAQYSFQGPVVTVKCVRMKSLRKAGTAPKSTHTHSCTRFASRGGRLLGTYTTDIPTVSAPYPCSRIISRPAKNSIPWHGRSDARALPKHDWLGSHCGCSGGHRGAATCQMGQIDRHTEAGNSATHCTARAIPSSVRTAVGCSFVYGMGWDAQSRHRYTPKPSALSRTPFLAVGVVSNAFSPGAAAFGS